MKPSTLAEMRRLTEGKTCGCKASAGGIQHCPMHAAAPEMLNALKLAQSALRDSSDEAGDVPMWNKGGIGYKASMAVGAAIKKAGS